METDSSRQDRRGSGISSSLLIAFGFLYAVVLWLLAFIAGGYGHGTYVLFKLFSGMFMVSKVGLFWGGLILWPAVVAMYVFSRKRLQLIGTAILTAVQWILPAALLSMNNATLVFLLPWYTQVGGQNDLSVFIQCVFADPVCTVGLLWYVLGQFLFSILLLVKMVRLTRKPMRIGRWRNRNAKLGDRLLI